MEHWPVVQRRQYSRLDRDGPSDTDDSVTQRVVLILGMHRSGTSCLAGSLQQAGLDLGDASTSSPHNPRGNRENAAFVRFNERVLNTNGGSWRQPPPSVVLNERQQARARALVAGFDGVPCWGFKDPRTLLLLDVWRELLPDAMTVGIFRHPLAVARSLAARDGMAEAEALALWCRYNRALLAAWRQRPFAMLDFDADERCFYAAIDSVCRSLALDAGAGVQRFFNRSLRSPAVGSALPVAVAALYDELKAVAALPGT